MKNKKELSENIVKAVMDMLLHFNNNTTTLEIKNILRQFDFKVKQQNVHEYIENIYINNNNIYNRINTGEYYIYEFKNNNIIIENDNDREPLYIYYISNDVLYERDLNVINNNLWVVYHKDMDEEYHIYNENLTRDLVRSKYASLLKVKIQDVRSCRLINFLK